MNAFPKLISCLIVNYNADKKLLYCVSKVFQSQSIVELIIIDNASTDNSLALVQRKFSDEGRLKIQRNPSNVGFSVACNQAVNIASGDYFLFLNPDCILGGDTTNFLLKAYNQYPSGGMSGPQLLNPDNSEQSGSRRRIPTLQLALMRVIRRSIGFDQNNEPVPEKIIEVEAISGACMLVSREAYEDVGGFDEGYFLHCEDLDLCMRFREKGWKILFVPDAKVTHYAGTCSKNRYLFVEWNKHKGMLRFYRKFYRKKYPLPLYWLVSMGVWGRYGLLAARHGVRQLFVRTGNPNG